MRDKVGDKMKDKAGDKLGDKAGRKWETLKNKRATQALLVSDFF